MKAARIGLGAFLTVAVFLGSSAAVLSDADLSGIEEAIRSRIERLEPQQGIYCAGELLCGSAVLPSFYEGRAFRPAWVDENGVLPQAEDLVRAIDGAWEEGLKPENYHIDAVKDLMRNTELLESRNTPIPVDTLTDLEMMLTDSFLLYASNLLSGLVNPETIQAEWFIKSREADLAVILGRALNRRDIPGALAEMRPQHSGYELLMRTLLMYIGLRDEGGWASVPAGDKLQKGDSGPRVRALYDRLIITADIDPAEPASPEVFGDELEQAVKKFQARHGLTVDGIVGSSTLAALNVSAGDRIVQIEANLERWRWLPNTFGDRYILVNIAGFEMDVVEDGQTALTLPVVVGTQFRKTPVFSELMTYLEINPYWNVPDKLAVEDVLPKVQKDVAYLEKKGFRLYRGWDDKSAEVDPATVDWTKLGKGNFPYRLRQDPGPLNSLGQIKFMFPNKYSVYLHDTPQKELFDRPARSFSSGCIRVSRALDVASFLLQESGWSREKIEEAIASKKNRIVNLPRYIPVFLIYLTAWVDERGRIQFRDDIYDRDKPLLKALSENPPGEYR